MSVDGSREGDPRADLLLVGDEEEVGRDDVAVMPLPARRLGHPVGHRGLTPEARVDGLTGSGEQSVMGWLPGEREW